MRFLIENEKKPDDLVTASFTTGDDDLNIWLEGSDGTRHMVFFLTTEGILNACYIGETTAKKLGLQVDNDGVLKVQLNS